MANGFGYLAQSMAPDILGSFERGRAQARQQQREQFADEELRARVERGNQFRQLAGQAYGASPLDRQQLLSQAAAADPQGAMALDQQLGAGEDQKQKRLGVWASALTRIPETNIEMRSALYQRMRPEMLQFGLNAPEQYTPEVGKMAEAFMAMGAGGGVQSTVIGQDGQYYTVNRSTGAFTPTGVMAAPNIRVLEQEGQLPYGVVTGRGAAGQVVPFGAPGAQPSPQAGAAPPPMAPSPGAAPATAVPPGATAPVPAPPGVGPVRIPTVAETAADKARAEAAVQLQTAPGIASATTRATEEAKAEAERARVAQLNQTAFQQYLAATANLQNAMAGTMTGPLAGRMPAVTSAQQIAEGAQATVAPVLKQLFRSAGEGTFTDRDQQLLLDMLPTRSDHPEAARAKIQMIDQLVAAKLGVAPPDRRRQGNAPAASASGAAPTATGPNGQKLILQNGQWVPLGG